MAARTISSLIADELLSRLLTFARKRAARQELFSGIAIALNDPIGLRLMATGMFEATQIDGVTQLLEMPGNFGLSAKPAGLFIDVGANIGLFTVAFSGFFDRTLAIEANPQTFAILQTNVLLRELGGVTCLRLAASNSNDSSILFVPADGNLGGATMNPHQHQSPKTFDIECRPLDQIIEEYAGETPVGLVKIDVEGHEFSVLQGAQKTLVRNRPVVLFEALDIPEATRCAELLVEYGYTRFFSFRRGRAGSKLMAMLTGLIQGLDVYPDQIKIDKIRRSPLICATG
jgi:FkbM family methyltransferase